MKVYKTDQCILIEEDNQVYVSTHTHWDSFLNRDDLYQALRQEVAQLKPLGDADWLREQKILAPIGSQEVWAVGVTYLRSRNARMEESQESGGATFYDKVYDAERPEIFFKQRPCVPSAPTTTCASGKILGRTRTRIGALYQRIGQNLGLHHRQRYEFAQH